MKNATQRLDAMQPSTNTTSQDGVRYLQSSFVATRRWIVEALGFQEVDLNAKANQKTGVFGYPIYDYSNGQRGGPVVNYLQLALQKPNFKIMSGVHVIRVDRHPKNIGHATGITATVNGNQTFFPVTCVQTGSRFLSILILKPNISHPSSSASHPIPSSHHQNSVSA